MAKEVEFSRQTVMCVIFENDCTGFGEQGDEQARFQQQIS